MISQETIHRVFKRHEVPSLSITQATQASAIALRYNASLSSEWTQMDTITLAPGLYQYTFIDDRTRYLIAAFDVYSK